MIVVKGAREHNLKNIDVKFRAISWWLLPVCLVRANQAWLLIRFMPKVSAAMWNRLAPMPASFLGLMEKPDVDQIDGLSPAISIDQKSTSRNPRSTVATVTEIYDYLRLLFARIGMPHCPICGKPVTRQTTPGYY